MGEDRSPGVRRGDPANPLLRRDGTGGGNENGEGRAAERERKSVGPGPFPIPVHHEYGCLQRVDRKENAQAIYPVPSSIDMPSDPIIVSLPELITSNLTGDFSGDENIPSSSSMPCSSRRPSLSVIPVRL